MRSMLVLALGGCVAHGTLGTPDTDPLDTGAGDTDVPEVRERTLTCDFERMDGLDLASGSVASVSPEGPLLDLQCSLGRYVGLRSFEADADEGTDDAGGVCDVSAGGPPPTFGDLGEIPVDPAACAWRSGLLCGVYTDPYTPACAGAGWLVRDGRRDALYRLRILEDDIRDGVGRLTFEYARAD